MSMSNTQLPPASSHNPELRGRVLLVAGSDSSGGADGLAKTQSRGLEADQKVLAAHGCYAMTATTALTAQNTLGVDDIYHIPADFVKKQIDAVFKDIKPDVIKTDLHRYSQHPGGDAAPDPAREGTPGDPKRRRPGGTGPKPAPVRSGVGLGQGGHTPFKADGTVAQTDEEKELVYDVLVSADSVTRIKGAYQKSKNTHGTGCSLASAVAANLSMGLHPIPAVKAACAYIEAAIRFAPGYGEGNGPLNHFHSMYTLPFAPDRFVDYLLDRPDVAPAKSMEDIAAGAKIVTHINTEMSLHLDYCASFGISKEQIEATEEHQACTAYTRYVLDVGMSSDWLALQVALAPCLLGYGAIGQALHDEKNLATKREGNTYYKWICNYVAEDYVEAVEELVKIFIHGTKMEIGFWEMFPSA
ncbi:hypothetical protein PG997_002435 [Apiospora hydei]|uniref:Phosphomethylpyrimidine kinase n=1 Tax=Apiospora hydei TaxID=1337664 RepID=A0ABR1X9I5_9PEZI